MRVSILESRSAVASLAADIVAAAAAEHPDLTLGLPTGNTAVPLYLELARRHSRGELDLSQARGFNLDELVLPPDHPETFKAFMKKHAWSVTGLDSSHCHIPDGACRNPDQEALRYERALCDAGGLDLAILGVGEDGHVAYNLPGKPVEVAHVVEIPARVSQRLGIALSLRPVRAITMGLGSFRNARHLILMANSPFKAHAVKALLDGPEDPLWPCSLLRPHPRFDVIVHANVSSGQGLQSSGSY